MKNFANAAVRFFKDEEGASAIEYALIVGMVALAIIGVSGAINTEVSDIFTKIKDALVGVST